MSVKSARDTLRQEFYKNSHVRDPRVIDMLVIKVSAGGSVGQVGGGVCSEDAESR